MRARGGYDGFHMPESVQSVRRAIALVEQLGDSESDMTLSELARRTELQPPTAHRLLRTLIALDWVVQDPSTSRYRLGHKLVSIVGGIEARTQRLKMLARPHLEALCELSGESTNLVVLDGLSAVYVDQVVSGRPIRMFAEIGARVPAYASGAGKAMLAVAPPAVRRALERETLEQLTPHTLTDHKRLAAELEGIARRGYAIDDEEYELGVACIGAAIQSADGVKAAALSISAPAARWRTLDRATLGEQLADHARELSAAIDPRPAADRS
jgi:IclR family acetate operon transcriptional repressor